MADIQLEAFRGLCQGVARSAQENLTTPINQNGGGV